MLSPNAVNKGRDTLQDRSFLANAMALSPAPYTPQQNKENGADRCASIARMQLMQPNLTAREIHEAYTKCQSSATPSPDSWNGK